MTNLTPIQQPKTYTEKQSDVVKRLKGKSTRRFQRHLCRVCGHPYRHQLTDGKLGEPLTLHMLTVRPELGAFDSYLLCPCCREKKLHLMEVRLHVRNLELLQPQLFNEPAPPVEVEDEPVLIFSAPGELTGSFVTYGRKVLGDFTARMAEAKENLNSLKLEKLLLFR